MVTLEPRDAASLGPVPALGQTPAAQAAGANASGLAPGRRNRCWWGRVVHGGLNWGGQGTER